MDSRQRRTGLGGWWAKYAGSVAFVALIILGATGFFKIQNNVDAIQQERIARVDATSGIIRLFCDTNNEQDTTLAKLVEVSLNGGTFGEGLDPAKLTQFDIAVLTSIAKVQRMTRDTTQIKVFRRELARLQDELPCGVLVESFLSGNPAPTDEPHGR